MTQVESPLTLYGQRDKCFCVVPEKELALCIMLHVTFLLLSIKLFQSYELL